MKIVVKYPPDFDGELHIEATEIRGLTPAARSWKFQFQHAASHGEEAWATLVTAARGILAQEGRRILPGEKEQQCLR
jgi:hypothetical protein